MQTEHFIPGKDAALETTIATLQGRLAAAGLHVEEHSWLNPLPGIWSVHLRERDCPLMFTNGTRVPGAIGAQDVEKRLAEAASTTTAN